MVYNATKTSLKDVLSVLKHLQLFIETLYMFLNTFQRCLDVSKGCLRNLKHLWNDKTSGDQNITKPHVTWEDFWFNFFLVYTFTYTYT